MDLQWLQEDVFKKLINRFYFIFEPLRGNKHGAALYCFMMPLFKADPLNEVECYLQSPVYVLK